MRAALLFAVCESMGLVALAARSEPRIDPQGWPETKFSRICARQDAGGSSVMTHAPALLVRGSQPRGSTCVEPAAPHRHPTCPRPGQSQTAREHAPPDFAAPAELDGDKAAVFFDCERHAAASPSTLTPTPMTTPAWTPALASAPASTGTATARLAPWMKGDTRSAWLRPRSSSAFPSR